MDTKPYTFICCLGETQVEESLGWLALSSAEKRGLDALSLCVVSLSRIAVLKIYKESSETLVHICQSTSQKEPVAVTRAALEIMGFGSEDTGEAWVVGFRSSLSEAGLESVGRLATGSWRICSPQDFAEGFSMGISRIIGKALFAPMQTKAIRKDWGLWLRWGVSGSLLSKEG